MEKTFEGLIQQLLEKGYGVADGFLSNDLVGSLSDNLKALKADDDLKRAGIGRQAFFQVAETYRKDQIHWLDNQSTDHTERKFLDTIGHFMDYLNRTCFTALRSCEFHYALYEKGSFYLRHLDQFQNDSGRKFSLIAYLNKDWKDTDGGELMLYLPAGEVKILPQAGRIVFFKSDEIEHEVKTAKRERMSVTGWLKDR